MVRAGFALGGDEDLDLRFTGLAWTYTGCSDGSIPSEGGSLFAATRDQFFCISDKARGLDFAVGGIFALILHFQMLDDESNIEKFNVHTMYCQEKHEVCLALGWRWLAAMSLMR